MASSIVDLAVLGKLFEEHRPKLLAMVRRRLDPALAPRIDAEDVLSEAFLTARRKWDAFKAQSDFSGYAWLYCIVRDCLIDAWRRETRGCRNLGREMPWPEQTSVQLGLGLVGGGTSPSAEAVREELRRQMRDALERLRPHDREILWMRHYDQLTFGEAAAVLGLTETAATVRYVRALKRLRTSPENFHREISGFPVGPSGGDPRGLTARGGCIQL